MSLLSTHTIRFSQPVSPRGRNLRSGLLATGLALTAMLTSNIASAQYRARDSATAGGVAGAIIGGIIGHQNDEVPEGAIIGGAVGALAGGLLGKAQQEDLNRQRYAQQQAYYAQQQQYYTQQQTTRLSGISTQDVVSMNRSGLSETLILGQLSARGVQRRLEVSEIIALHQAGVSDNIIGAMQSVPLATQIASRTTARPATVPQQPVYSQQTVIRQQPIVVREPVIYAQPPVVYERVYRAPPVYHRPYHRHARSGASIRIGF
ncbi:MAG: glycine zipper domain-containing protein [Pirellulaceae bacterium]